VVVVCRGFCGFCDVVGGCFWLYSSIRYAKRSSPGRQAGRG